MSPKISYDSVMEGFVKQTKKPYGFENNGCFKSEGPSMLNPLGFLAATQRAVVVEVETWAWQQLGMEEIFYFSFDIHMDGSTPGSK